MSTTKSDFVAAEEIKGILGGRDKGEQQFAATVAYFYHFVAPERDRKDTITKDDLQTAARLANRRRYPRPAIPLDNAVTNGYLDRLRRAPRRQPARDVRPRGGRALAIELNSETEPGS